MPGTPAPAVEHKNHLQLLLGRRNPIVEPSLSRAYHLCLNSVWLQRAPCSRPLACESKNHARGVQVVRMATVFKAALLMGGLGGCAAQSPAQPLPLVALPGAAKTEAQVREDDAACRTEALQAPSNVPSQPTAVQPAAAQSAAAQPTLGQGQPSANTAAAAAMPPGVVYLRCMTSRQNVVESLNPTPPPLYGYYAPYPLYAGVGFGYPFFVTAQVSQRGQTIRRSSIKRWG